MKGILVIPLTSIVLVGCLKAGCSYDTMFLCIAIILAGYVASKD